MFTDAEKAKYADLESYKRMVCSNYLENGLQLAVDLLQVKGIPCKQANQWLDKVKHCARCKHGRLPADTPHIRCDKPFCTGYGELNCDFKRIG